MTGEFTVSIVSHGHGDLLGPLLEDLRRYAPDARVIVTLNIPEQGLAPESWPGVEFVRNCSPKGFGANHNTALRSANTEWLVILNPDIRLSEATFAGIARAVENEPTVDMFAPVIVGPDGEVQDSARPLPTPLRVLRRVLTRLAGRTPAVEPMSRATWFAGMFLLVRREAFSRVGGFDERFFMYGEDVALSVQLVANGRRIRAVQDAIAIHDARRATLRSFRHLRWHLGSLLRLWSWPAFYRHERRYLELEQQF